MPQCVTRRPSGEAGTGGAAAELSAGVQKAPAAAASNERTTVGQHTPLNGTWRCSSGQRTNDKARTLAGCDATAQHARHVTNPITAQGTPMHTACRTECPRGTLQVPFAVGSAGLGWLGPGLGDRSVLWAGMHCGLGIHGVSAANPELGMGRSAAAHAPTGAHHWIAKGGGCYGVQCIWCVLWVLHSVIVIGAASRRRLGLNVMRFRRLVGWGYRTSTS